MSIIENKKTSFEILKKADLPARRVAAGDVIISEGTESKEMFIIRDGRVAISVGGTTVEEIGAGGVFGEMGLIDYQARSATATALDDCELVPIDERLFVILVHDTPHFALDVMATLVGRIRAMNDVVASND